MNIRVQSNPSSAHCHQPGGGVSLLIQHDFLQPDKHRQHCASPETDAICRTGLGIQ